MTRMHTSAALAALLAMGAGVAHGAGGVPVVDPASIAQAGATIALEEKKDAALAEAAKKQDQKTSLEQRQLEAVDATLAAMTGLTDVSGLEGLSGAPAAEVYPIEDSNPHANRLFGDARVTIEQMIAETAAKYTGHPALARAGINPVEWRCWFQGLVKQESNFSIGARSSAAAFGLTQIIPGTAKYLGIYPDYYTDPRLQLDGGARYLLEQLNRFGSIQLALAAYNAGPGAVQKYGGVPPYKETQDYVVKISGYYSRYAARVTGADAVGTLDPRDMAIAEASNIGDASASYAAYASGTIPEALTRLRAILTRIPKTRDVKEAMDLNTYARAEATRIAFTLSRLKAAKTMAEQARYRLLWEAYARDELYLALE